MCVSSAYPSGPSERENPVHNNNNTEGGGDGCTANGKDDAPIRNNSGKPDSGTDETEDDEQSANTDSIGMDGEESPAPNNQPNTKPVDFRFSTATQTADAGSIGWNGIFNRDNNFGPWDVEYCVIEDNPLLQQLNAADNLQMGVYGNTIHQNNSLHLDGGIENDGLWQ